MAKTKENKAKDTKDSKESKTKEIKMKIQPYYTYVLSGGAIKSGICLIGKGYAHPESELDKSGVQGVGQLRRLVQLHQGTFLFILVRATRLTSTVLFTDLRQRQTSRHRRSFRHRTIRLPTLRERRR